MSTCAFDCCQIAANGLPQLVEYLESVENAGDSCISFLIKNGAKVNVVDIYGQTPLHFAAMRGNEIAARDLLGFQEINVEVRYTDDAYQM